MVSSWGLRVRRRILVSISSIQAGIDFGNGGLKKKKMESSGSGQGGSATRHRSYLLTLPMLAAQSPPGGGPEQGEDVLL